MSFLQGISSSEQYKCNEFALHLFVDEHVLASACLCNDLSYYCFSVSPEYVNWLYIFFVKVIIMSTENELLIIIIQGFPKYSYIQNVIYKIFWALSAIFFTFPRYYMYRKIKSCSFACLTSSATFM